MELRDLRYFVAVAQHRNVSRAAEQLHVSQPALSEQIRKLEEELGTPLFARTSRGVDLTEAGETLLGRARTLLAQADEAADAVRTLAHGVAGTLTLGFIDSAALGIVPPLLRRFTQAYPNVKLDVRELGTRSQLEALRSGELDVGIVRGPVWDAELQGTRIATETLLVALPAQHALANAPVVAMRALRDEGFISYPAERGAGLYEEMLRLCHDAGFDPRIAQEANEIYTICGMVAGGLGVAIVPESVTAIALAGIVYRPTDDRRAHLERWAVWRETAPSALVRAFVETISPESSPSSTEQQAAPG